MRTAEQDNKMLGWWFNMTVDNRLAMCGKHGVKHSDTDRIIDQHDVTYNGNIAFICYNKEHKTE